MLFWIFWGDGHDLAYFVNDQSKSKVLGHLTAQHVILISTSARSSPLFRTASDQKLRGSRLMRMACYSTQWQEKCINAGKVSKVQKTYISL